MYFVFYKTQNLIIFVFYKIHYYGSFNQKTPQFTYSNRVGF